MPAHLFPDGWAGGQGMPVQTQSTPRHMCRGVLGLIQALVESEDCCPPGMAGGWPFWPPGPP